MGLSHAPVSTSITDSIVIIMLLIIEIYHCIQASRSTVSTAGDINSPNQENSVYLSLLLIAIALIFEAILSHIAYTDTQIAN